MKTIRIIKLYFTVILLTNTACTKNEDTHIDQVAGAEYLQFNMSATANVDNSVLYSNWVKTGLPSSSNFGSVQWNLPYIPNDLLDLEKDLVIIYAKRNHLFQLPMSAPTSNEDYTVDFGKYEKGVLASVRVYAQNWETQPLNDIFFGASSKAMFRVVIVPGEKLFELQSQSNLKIDSMTYNELAILFNLPD